MITICKFSVADRLVIDYILERCKITVASSVCNEVVIAGANYPDARVARRRIEQGQIAVLTPPLDPDLETLIVLYGLVLFHTTNLDF